MPRLIFTGDLVPSLADNTLSVSGELNEFFQSCDLHITNLEAPLTRCNSKILKTGPHIKVDPKNRSILGTLGVDIACLANNHIYDYGVNGVRDTVRYCEEIKVMCIGSYFRENNLDHKFVIKEIGGIKILILNYCESEFSVRENPSDFGSVAYEIVDVLTDINMFRSEVDFIIMVFHGGNEYHNFPSQHLQKEFRFLLDSGIDAIIAHHPHIIGGVEEYKGKPIFYSLGNFLFPFPGEPAFWDIGLVAVLEITDKIDYSYRTVKYDSQNMNLGFLTGKEEESMRVDIQKISEIIQDDKLLLQVRSDYLKSKKKDILASLLEFGYIDRILIKFGYIDRILLRQKGRLLKLLNFMRSKSHRELIIDCISEQTK